MNSMNLRLKPGEKLYVNGAVIRVDRRVSIELLNDVTFLLQSHVLQLEDASSPLRQLYFAIQSVIIDPKSSDETSGMINVMLADLLATFSDNDVIYGLLEVQGLVKRGRFFDSLRVVRGLFWIEDSIISVGHSFDPAAA